MKIINTLVVPIIFYFITFLSFSQTLITNKDYKVADDVVEIEEYCYHRNQCLDLI